MILFLVKFLAADDHVRDLLDGNIYANRLSWFKKVEDGDSSGRLDRHEGAVVWHQPDRIHLVINSVDMTPDLAAPVEIHSNRINYLNIFSMYAARLADTEPESTPEEIPQELISQLAISASCLSLGQYAVVIRNIPEFIQRVGAAAKARRYRMWYGRVNYYNPDTYHGDHSDIDALFQKQDRHSYQSEFRLVFDTLTEGDDPIILEIGDIRDIALRFATTKLNEELLGIS